MSAADIFNRHGKRTLAVLAALGGIAAASISAASYLDSRIDTRATGLWRPAAEAAAVEHAAMKATQTDHEERLRRLEEMRIDVLWIRREMERRRR